MRIVNVATSAEDRSRIQSTIELNTGEITITSAQTEATLESAPDSPGIMRLLCMPYDTEGPLLWGQSGV